MGFNYDKNLFIDKVAPVKICDPTKKPIVPEGYSLSCKNGKWELLAISEQASPYKAYIWDGSYNGFVFGSGLSSSEKGSVLNASERQLASTLLSRSVYKIVDLVCEGPISGFYYNSGTYGNDPLTSTYFDGVRVRDVNGSYNFNLTGIQGFSGSSAFSFNYTLGESGQSGIPGFRRVENFVMLPGNTSVDYPPPKHGTKKNVTVVIQKKDYPDIQGIKVTVKTPALYRMDEEGETRGGGFRYAVRAKFDNGDEVDLLPIRPLRIWKSDKAVIEYKKEKQILGIANSVYLDTVTIFNEKFLENWKEITLSVVRTSEKIISNRTANDLYVESISVIGANNYSYPNSVIVAATYNSTQLGQVPNRSYDLMGLLVNVPNGYSPPEPTFNGTWKAGSYPSIWVGDFAASKKWTSNPAWVFYDIITNKRYGLGDYFPESSIDKWSLYEIAKYCDELVDDGRGGLEPRFQCNVVLQERQDAYNLLQNLVSCFQGMLYWGYGTLFVNTSKLYSAVYNFTNANVVDGKFTYSDSAKSTRSTVVKIKWRDPDNLYKEDVVKVEDVEGILKYGYIEKEISSFGCTSRGQATRYANWVLESERLLTETVSFKTFLEGIYIKPGDCFNIFDNFTQNKNQGGRVVKIENNLTGIKLDRKVDLEIGKTYEISIVRPYGNADFNQITGSNQFSLINNSQLNTRQVYSLAQSGIDYIGVSPALDTGISNGAVWILNCTTSGASQNQSRLFRCLSTLENTDGHIEILGLETDTGISYRTSTGYSANGTQVGNIVRQAISAPSYLNVQLHTGLVLGYFDRRYKLAWGAVNDDNFAYYNISGSVSGSDYFNVAQVYNETAFLGNFSSSGYYRFLVGAVSDEGEHSTYVTGGLLNTMFDNPLGGPVEITGHNITLNNDPYRPLTGYYDDSFLFNWEIERMDSDYYSPKTAFFSGFKVKILNPSTDVVVHEHIENQVGAKEYGVLISNLTGYGLNKRRDVKIQLTSCDIWGGETSPYEILFYNNPPSAPVGSGFYHMLGGLNFNVTNDVVDQDLSGIALWINTGDSFAPSFSNVTASNNNIEGFLNHSLQPPYYCWFSLIDTFGSENSPVYGPILIENSSPVVTGIKTNNGNFIRNGVEMSGAGGVNLTQNGQTIIVSGERNAFNLGFFLDSMPEETGIAVGELISSRSFVLTGCALSCRTTSSDVFSGSLYYCNLDNSSKMTIGQIGLPALSTNVTYSIPYTGIPEMKKIGYDVLASPADMEKLSIGLFGFDVK